MNQIVLVHPIVLVVVIVIPPIVRRLNVPTVLRAGWVPRVTIPVCMDIQIVEFAFAIILAMQTAVVS